MGKFLPCQNIYCTKCEIGVILKVGRVYIGKKMIKRARTHAYSNVPLIRNFRVLDFTDFVSVFGGRCEKLEVCD